jgi:hypothetical protein
MSKYLIWDIKTYIFNIVLLVFCSHAPALAQEKTIDATQTINVKASMIDTKMNPSNLNLNLTDEDIRIYNAIINPSNPDNYPTLKLMKGTNSSAVKEQLSTIFNCSTDAESVYDYRLVRTSAIAPIVKMDSSLIHQIIVLNRAYSFLLVNKYAKEEDKELFNAAIEKISPPLKLNALDVVENLIPAVFAVNNKFSLLSYKRTVLEYFAHYPILLDFCDDSFLYLLTENKFNVLHKLSTQSRNNLKFNSSNK